MGKQWESCDRFTIQIILNSLLPNIQLYGQGENGARGGWRRENAVKAGK